MLLPHLTAAWSWVVGSEVPYLQPVTAPEEGTKQKGWQIQSLLRWARGTYRERANPGRP